jgi:hypothetical protein
MTDSQLPLPDPEGHGLAGERTDPDPHDPELAARDPEDQEVAAQLTAARAMPAAGFRGELGRHLLALDPGYGPRPARLHASVLAFLTAGLALLCLAALIAVGAA